MSESIATTEDIQVKVHEKGACRIELEVKAPDSMVKKAKKNAIKALNKEITVPGFRKGRAPDELILKKFPNDVEKKSQKELADLAFIAAQKTANVPLLNNNSPISFDLKNLTEDQGADLVFSFETEPKIPSVDISSFTPKEVIKAEVGEKQIEEAIHQMRFFYATWKPVTDRPIRDGDYIIIDLETVEEGQPPQKVFNHIRFEVSKNRMANWMKTLVDGAKVHDVLEGMSEPDDQATEEQKKEFKPKKVRVMIHKVEEATLPEVDDEFAKKVGAADVAQMRQSIADLLNKQADEKAQNELRDQINDHLVQSYSFELPKSLIDTESKHRLNQMLQDPNFKKKWNQMSQDERKKVGEDLAEEANQAVRLFYISRSIVQNEKIPVTHQEVQQEAIRIFQSHGGKSSDQLPKEVFALALSKVILAKAQDCFLKKA